MKYSVAIPEEINKKLLSHLIREDGQEDATFCLWMPSSGKERYTALLNEIVLPLGRDRSVHGNVTLSQDYFLRVIGQALSRGAGIALLHSHPARGWQRMSTDDENTEKYFSPRAYGATDLPFVGLTLGLDGTWSARFWNKSGKGRYLRHWCENVRVVGSEFKIFYNDNLIPKPSFKPEFERTKSAWGEDVQARLMRLRIGVIGVGGVGSIIAEVLARMGIMNMSLIDFDSVEVVNLDRLIHARKKDAKMSAAKVKVVSSAIRKSATADDFHVTALEFSVTEEEGFRHALDCDVLFSCVDRPWPRFVLNYMAYAHLIPIVDGGVRIIVDSESKLKKANFGAHIASPSRRCLECLEQYKAGLVSVEKVGLLDDPNYIQGLPQDSPFRHNENVIAFNLGAASLEILQFLSMIISPYGLSNIGTQMYDFVTGSLNKTHDMCENNCPFPKMISQGDHSAVKVTDRHKVAELARQKRNT